MPDAGTDPRSGRVAVVAHASAVRWLAWSASAATSATATSTKSTCAASCPRRLRRRPRRARRRCAFRTPSDGESRPVRGARCHTGVGRRAGAWVVSASPERYLSVDGDAITSSPIKGTAAPGEAMLPKDEAENVMITDLIRNDLSRVAVPGSVGVPEFLALHEHPGLTHLQSTVQATLAEDCAWTPDMWRRLFEGTFPPGSVSGAPRQRRCGSLRARKRTTRALLRSHRVDRRGQLSAPSSRSEFARFGGTTLQGGP